MNYIDTKVEEVMESKPMKFLSGLHAQQILVRGGAQWEGETTEDVIRKAFNDLLTKAREAVPSERKYFNDNYTDDRERDLAKNAATNFNYCRETTLNNLNNL